MARKPAKRIYGTSGRPMAEALPLALAFIIGVGGEIILKILPGVSVFAPAALAITVLLAYALVAYNATELRLDAETIGDNCYYLGFLFTLTALSISLYFVVREDAGSRAELIPEIISGFGVALASTIAGVFLRVFMMQFKIDMDSQERRERQQLNEASRRFRTELAMSVDQIKAFSVESLQHNVERETKLREAFDGLLSEMQTELLKSAQDFGPALRESVKLQTDASLAMVTAAVNDSSALAADRIREAMTEMTEVAGSLSTRNVEAAERVSQSLTLLLASAELLSKGSEETMSRLARTQGAATTLTEAFTTVSREGAEEMSRVMKDATAKLETGAHDLGEAASRAGGIIDKGATQLGEGFETAAASVRAGGERLGENLQTLTLDTARTRRFDRLRRNQD
ncbi:hypothetical protein PSM7751_00712 [Pseudooceanicola marinus]|uniref:Apolipoprotein A1/A4/E domain protein n=1 Tax=Pseudooceanicola marinus TaxID=396013 RepID=A0A1X6YH32_9RHOB|nr:hypothetical protein [Pseudooceanicola marinus]PJE26488.1 hypothetical protein CVM50_19310 [Pseudooceanicola marinus]SLN20843.1 hypothetical protein PSM7751_00712 [Pseudooceanicola marinus]